MTIPIGSVSLTVNTPGTFRDAPPMGVLGLIISNESPFNVAISLQGTSQGGTLLPETVNFFPVDRGFNGVVAYSPTSVVTNPASYTAATLAFEAVGLNEPFNRSAYPIALTRPAVTATASGKPIFSATFGIGASVGNRQAINVFNPANSGINMTFHSAEAFSNRSDWPTANLMFLSGGDLNLPIPVAAVSHNGTATPPVSFAHCTAMDQGPGNPSTAIIEVQQLALSTVTDLLNFPDNATLAPGGNLRIEIIASVANNLSRVTLKWSEDIAVPQQGGIPTGVVMTSIVNTGKAAPTPVVSASPAGDGAIATLINNDGTMTLGDAATSLQGVINGGPTLQLFAADNGDLSLSARNGDVNVSCLQDTGNPAFASRVFMRVNHFWNGTNDIFVSANPAYQWAFNRTLGALSLRINSNAPSTGGIVTWTADRWLINIDGSISLLTQKVTVNGSVSGSADCYQIFQGTYKYTLVYLNAWRSASAQNITLPVAYTTGAWVRTGGIGPSTDGGFKLLSSATPQTINVITALAATGGTTSGVTQMYQDSMGECISGFDQVAVWSNTNPHTGFIVLEGI